MFWNYKRRKVSRVGCKWIKNYMFTKSTFWQGGATLSWAMFLPSNRCLNQYRFSQHKKSWVVFRFRKGTRFSFPPILKIVEKLLGQALEESQIVFKTGGSDLRRCGFLRGIRHIAFSLKQNRCIRYDMARILSTISKGKQKEKSATGDALCTGCRLFAKPWSILTRYKYVASALF